MRKNTANCLTEILNDAPRRFPASSSAGKASLRIGPLNPLNPLNPSRTTGLGDRHTENVLIDTTNAENINCDFDCLFDKGLSLARPEIVPFRLTPNMVDAMVRCIELKKEEKLEICNIVSVLYVCMQGD